MVLGERVNVITEKFPRKEQFNITSQMLRAADSIALNIAEGSISQSNPEFRRFMSYAIRSLAEVVTCMIKAKNRNYITSSEYQKLYSSSYNLMNMMVAFKRNLK